MTSSQTGSEPEMPHPGSGRKETGGLSPSPEAWATIAVLGVRARPARADSILGGKGAP